MSTQKPTVDDKQNSTNLPIEISNLPNITTTDKLKDAFLNYDPALFENTTGKARIETAKQLNWSDEEFPTEHSSIRHGIILEEVNTEKLAVLAPNGTVYQRGDKIKFEQRKSTVWGGSKTTQTKQYELYITGVSTNMVHTTRNPTYSNIPRDSPSASFDRTEIEIIERGDLDTLRNRYTEGTEIKATIPEEVNGWQLKKVETRKEDSDHSGLLPTNLITEIAWGNDDGGTITAKWRGVYGCWYLSTPYSDRIVCSENEDDYLYEIDVPQQVVATEEIIDLAVEYMNAVKPSDIQRRYDLRHPDNIEEEKRMYHGPPDVTIPDKIGDWVAIKREAGRIKWENQNESSPWHEYTVMMTSKANCRVRDEEKDEIHDVRHVKKVYPSGDESPRNIASEEYMANNRDMFNEHWYYGVGFMLETTVENLQSSDLVETLSTHTPDNVDLLKIDHGISTDTLETHDEGNTSLKSFL